MRKILILARREYQALIRTKAFIVSLVAMPIFMFGAIFVQTFLQEHLDTGEKIIVVLDGTGRLLAPLQALAEVRDQVGVDGQASNHKPRKSLKLEAGPAGPVTDELRLELSDRVRRNEIFAFVEIDANALKPSDNSPLMQLLRSMVRLNPLQRRNLKLNRLHPLPLREGRVRVLVLDRMKRPPSPQLSPKGRGGRMSTITLPSTCTCKPSLTTKLASGSSRR